VIYNSNRYFLAVLLRRLGCEVSDLGIVPDRRDATLSALQQAAESHDLIVTSGGVSVGEEDHVKPAVQQLGGLDLWQIAIKPGKPFAQGWIGRAGDGGNDDGRCHFVGLPGNPVSSFVTFLLLVRPLLLRLQGITGGPGVESQLGADGLPPALSLPAHFDWPRADRRREFLRVRRNAGGLDLFPNQSSGVLTSVAWCDGLVDLPAGQTIARGDRVNFHPLAALLG
jgi:molybdopterin molybdotransferase